MNRYKLSKAGVDPNDALKRFNNNVELYETLLNSFIYDKNYMDMCRAITDGDVQGAFLYAHALKGLAGNLSFTRIFDDLTPIVELLRSGSLENAEDLLIPVIDDYEAVYNAISEGLQTTT